MKKLFGLLTICVFIFMGCSNESAGPQEVRFTWWGSNERNNATLEMVDLYNSSQDEYEVVPEYFDYDSYETRLTTQMASNSAACVVQTDFPWYQNYESSAWLDLSEYSQELQLKNYSEGLLGSLNTDGVQVGVPISLTTFVLNWNQTMLDEYGIVKPETWEEVIAAGKKIHEQNSDVYLLRIPGDSITNVFENYMYQITGKLPLDDNGVWQWTTEEVKTGLEGLEVILNEAMPPAEVVPGGQTDMSIEEGLVAGGISLSTWLDTQVLRNDTDKLSYSMWPSVEGQVTNGVTVSPGMSYSIPSSCENVDGAIDFLSFITTDIDALTLQGLNRGVPANNEAAKKLIESGVIENSNSVEVTEAINDIETAPFQALDVKVVDALQEAVDAIRFETDTLDTLASNIVEVGEGIYL